MVKQRSSEYYSQHTQFVILLLLKQHPGNPEISWTGCLVKIGRIRRSKKVSVPFNKFLPVQTLCEQIRGQRYKGTEGSRNTKWHENFARLQTCKFCLNQYKFDRWCDQIRLCDQIIFDRAGIHNCTETWPRICAKHVKAKNHTCRAGHLRYFR